MDKNFSRVVGVVQDDVKPLFMNEDESFIMTHVACSNAFVPVVMSEYFFNEYTGKRVEIVGYPKIASRKGKNKKVSSYYYGVFVKGTTDEQDVRYIEIEGTISELCDLEFDYRNRCVRTFELECQMQFDRPTAEKVPCRIYGRQARESLCLHVGDTVRINGFISGGHNSLRVIVQKYEKITKDMEDT